MRPVKKPTWQQATALVSLSTAGAMTGFSFTHGTVAEMTSPTSMPVHLLDASKPVQPETTPTADSTLRAGIINVANYYLRMAQSKTPAEMEAIIWQQDSVDGVDHGESCAAFASLTLELGAKAAGQESWVSGGTSYPWPLHSWADVRVDANPSSPNVVSVVQDAESNHRWHPLGDGYRPQPGDWVLFNQHVEVVTKYAKGVLYTIGGDSLPGFTVNAHRFSVPLASQGVVGFVNNGEVPATASADQHVPATAAAAMGGTVSGGTVAASAGTGQAAIPGMLAAALTTGSTSGGSTSTAGHAAAAQSGGAASQSAQAASSGTGAAAIPGLQAVADDVVSRPSSSSSASSSASSSSASSSSASSSASASGSYSRPQQLPSTSQVPGTAAQAAFISQVAPGAMAAQVRYGIPAAVTIAQAIEESGWGQSTLAVRDHNLFGIKGTGPAGADLLPTKEYENGHWVTQTAAFKVYHNVAESIADHSLLLATGPSYAQAMADRHVPDAFAADLTGVYATDPGYGANLIALMKLYNLYRYDPSTPSTAHAASSGDSGSAETAGRSSGASTSSESGTSAGSGTSGGAGTSGGSVIPAGMPAEGTTTNPGSAAGQGASSIPGVLDAVVTGTPTASMQPAHLAAMVTQDEPVSGQGQSAPRPGPRIAPRTTRAGSRRYVPQIPRAVTTDFISTAKAPLARTEPLYRDVATHTGIRWQLLAACDWMQCRSQARFSPVRGEKLGTVNPDGTVYHNKSEALDQAANDLIELAMAVYWIDITARRPLSVRDLANVFAAFRWGGLLKLHNISAMEFPYSVEGLTAQHLKMRWPVIKDSNPPDKAGARFRSSFGAVPVALSLEYPALAE